MFEIYNWFKFLHVAAVIIWIGGVSVFSVINARVARGQDMAVLASLLQQSVFYGRAIIGPAAGITLLAGIAAAGRAGISFGSLWITWGFLGIFVSMFLGLLPIRRATEELGRLAAADKPDESRLAGARRRLTLLNTINLLLLLSVVGAMVLKPTL
jgi:uncharacterized membrane protein